MKKLFIASLVLFTFFSCSDENLNPTEVKNKVELSMLQNQLLIKFKPTEAELKQQQTFILIEQLQ
jgi:hypothetical protein